MTKKILKNKLWIVVGFCLALVLSSTNAFAWEGHHRDRYYWHGDRYYRHNWFGWDVAVTALTIGVVAARLPYGYTTIIVGGVPHYYYDGIYYRTCPTGYVVVPAPEVSPVIVASSPVVVAAPATVIATPPASGGSVVVINVPNTNGSYTPVRLVKHNNGYIGPQGEFYSGNPTVDQLKALYGK